MINTSLSNQEPLLSFTLLENSCCNDLLEGYRYINFIDKMTNGELVPVIKNTWDILPYFNLFNYKGTITKLYITPKFKLFTYNKSIHEIITENIIMKKFETYCYTGLTKGDLHHFVGKNELERCVKCKQSVAGINGFVLIKAEFNRNQDWTRYKILRQYPLCLDCWKIFNNEITNSKRDGEKEITKRIKKTIIKRLR